MQTMATKKPRPPAKRRKLDCPIPGGAITNVSKLADHIRTQHPKYTTEERHDWLHKARLIQPPKFVPINKHFQKLKDLKNEASGKSPAVALPLDSYLKRARQNHQKLSKCQQIKRLHRNQPLLLKHSINSRHLPMVNHIIPWTFSQHARLDVHP